MTATTIEQSKHLLRLGLDPSTADMMWDDWSLIDEGWKISVGYYPEIEKDYGRKCYPAWSLSALLEVISKVTCISYLTIDTSYLIRCKDLGFLWQKDIAAKDPVTAAYEMVCWLLEQGLIKKGSQDV